MNIDVLILGGNMPGVMTAIECAKLGLKVAMVFNELDVPNTAVTDGSGGWSSLMTELELDAPVAITIPPAFVRSAKGHICAVLPESLLGIPSSPLAAEVVECIGQSAATRAYLDRIKPVLTIGKERHLAALVSKRMGTPLLNTLVQPFVVQRFGADAAHVDVAIAAPGLNEAITRTGSLSTGVLATFAALNERERSFTLPAPTELSQAIRKRLEFWSVQVVDAQPDTFDLDTADLSYRALVIADTPGLADRVIGVRNLGLTELAVRSTVTVTVEADIPVGYVGIGETSAQQPWSVEVQSADGENRMLMLAGPRSIHALGSALEPEELSEADIVHILLDAGIQPTGAPQADPVSMHAAPFTTLEEEHARQGILKVLRALDSQRVVGNWLYQGDESAAIVAARTSAQSLRRHLLGLN